MYQLCVGPAGVGAGAGVAPLEGRDALLPTESALRVEAGCAVALAALEVADEGAADLLLPVLQREGGVLR